MNFILHLHLYCESSSGVEHHLAKVGVAGSNPVFRSTIKVNARVVELVDTLDLKSNDHCGRAGSSPASSTRNPSLWRGFFLITCASSVFDEYLSSISLLFSLLFYVLICLFLFLSNYYSISYI